MWKYVDKYSLEDWNSLEFNHSNLIGNGVIPYELSTLAPLEMGKQADFVISPRHPGNSIENIYLSLTLIKQQIFFSV